MNTTLLERLRTFQIPSVTPISPGHFIVARLQGIDFEGIFNSPDFGFERPFDVNFGKILIKTASYLLGGDSDGRFAFVEPTEFSMLFDHRRLAAKWTDALELQNYLVGLASSKMSLLLEDETLFTCNLYAFSKSDLVLAYFLWRRQEAGLSALDRYCIHVLSKADAAAGDVANILEGLGPLEKEEILRQNRIEYRELPSWQRNGACVYLNSGEHRVVIDTNLPPENAFGRYIQPHLD